jgi:hypothetical protein
MTNSPTCECQGRGKDRDYLPPPSQIRTCGGSVIIFVFRARAALPHTAPASSPASVSERQAIHVGYKARPRPPDRRYKNTPRPLPRHDTIQRLPETIGILETDDARVA